MNIFFKRIFFLFKNLDFKKEIGGLEISDSALQFVTVKNNDIAKVSLKIPPGVISEGKIVDEEQFTILLRKFHEGISFNGKKIIEVVVSLPASVVYTQSFDIPNIGEEKLKEAAVLNLQTISPLSLDKAYMGWQVLKETQERYELLGAVVSKDIIDMFRKVLEKANFRPIVFEFPALALARLALNFLGKIPQPILLLRISSDGLNLLIFMNGALYFDYFDSWRAIQGESREILLSVFEATIIEEVQRVLNFSLSRFRENISEVLVIAPGFEDEIKKLLENKFNLKTTSFVLNNYSLTQNWYVALGSAIRRESDRDESQLISLGAGSISELMQREKIIMFIKFWRSIYASVLMGLFAIFALSAFYLMSQVKLSSAQLKSVIQAPPKELSDLSAKATVFNNLVGAIKRVKSEEIGWFEFLRDLETKADSNLILLERIDIVSANRKININAQAPSYETVTKFKSIIASDSRISNIDLPLSGIVNLPSGSVLFNISFNASL